MSISSEYDKYRKGGGTLTKTEYGIHLNGLKTTIGNLINSDPKNIHSDIGKRIFNHLDINTAMSFSQISKGVYARSQDRWFVSKCNEIVLRYVKQGTTFRDYVSNGGWQDFIILSTKIAGTTLTITAGVQASIHAHRIPPDAPRKTTTYTDDYGHTHEVTYIDHPEVYKRNAWAIVSAGVGIVTVAMIGHGLLKLLNKIDLDIFFSTTEKDIIGSQKCSIGLKIISPGFHAWKLAKMKERLTSNPPNWETHQELKQMICPISGAFMLFPVKDKCGHYFDYRSVRGYQLDPDNKKPLECPVSSKKPNNGLATLKFDKAKFDRIQRILRG